MPCAEQTKKDGNPCNTSTLHNTHTHTNIGAINLAPTFGSAAGLLSSAVVGSKTSDCGQCVQTSTTRCLLLPSSCCDLRRSGPHRQHESGAPRGRHLRPAWAKPWRQPPRLAPARATSHLLATPQSLPSASRARTVLCAGCRPAWCRGGARRRATRGSAEMGHAAQADSGNLAEPPAERPSQTLQLRAHTPGKQHPDILQCGASRYAAFPKPGVAKGFCSTPANPTPKRQHP